MRDGMKIDYRPLLSDNVVAGGQHNWPGPRGVA